MENHPIILVMIFGSILYFVCIFLYALSKVVECSAQVSVGFSKKSLTSCELYELFSIFGIL